MKRAIYLSILFVFTLSLVGHAAAFEVMKLDCAKTSGKFFCRGEFPAALNGDEFYTEDSDGKTFYVALGVPMLNHLNEATVRFSVPSQLVSGWTRDRSGTVEKDPTGKMILYPFASQDSWCEDESGNWVQECPVEFKVSGSFTIVIDDVRLRY